MTVECPIDGHTCDRMQCINKENLGIKVEGVTPCELAAAGLSIQISGEIMVKALLAKEIEISTVNSLISATADQLGINRKKFAERVVHYSKSKTENPLYIHAAMSTRD